MSERDRLPERRDGEVATFEHMGHKVHVGASWYGDGRLAELFFNAGRTGTLLDIVMREMATVVSIALQSGVPLDVIENSLPKLVDGSPAGPLGRALEIMRAPDGSISVPDTASRARKDAP